MTDKKFFLVTGLPRSGTSVLAGVLHNLGINMLNGRPPRTDGVNPTGYFEDLKIANINMRHTNSRTFDGYISTVNKVINGHEINANPLEYHNPLKHKVSKGGDLIGFKDPRLCFSDLLEIFLSTLRFHITKENIKVLFTHRDIYSIVSSLASLNAHETDIPNLLKLYSDAIMTVRNGKYKYMLVSYEMLVDNPDVEIKRIADFCEVDVTRKAIDIVRPDLKRH